MSAGNTPVLLLKIALELNNFGVPRWLWLIRRHLVWPVFWPMDCRSIGVFCQQIRRVHLRWIALPTLIWLTRTYAEAVTRRAFIFSAVMGLTHDLVVGAGAGKYTCVGHPRQFAGCTWAERRGLEPYGDNPTTNTDLFLITLFRELYNSYIKMMVYPSHPDARYLKSLTRVFSSSLHICTYMQTITLFYTLKIQINQK